MGTNPNLPQDIILNILSRLPVKPLGQFKSVSKSWQSLISHSHFVNLHLNRAILDASANHFRLLTSTPLYSLDYESPSSFEDVQDDNAIIELAPPIEDQELAPKILGSCNGLICLLCGLDTIVLWNPTTKSSRKLPKPQSLDVPKFFHGFGFDPSTDDYKVVRASWVNSETKVMVQVFSLKDNSWRLIQGPEDHITIQEEEMGTYMNGALHWEGRDSVKSGDSKGQELIVFLDLKEEKFGVFSKPDMGDFRFYTLGNLGGSLSLLQGNRHSHIDVWVMKEYGVAASWSRLTSLRWIEVEYEDYFVPICFAKNGELIADADGMKLVRYNIQENTYRELKNRCEQYFDWVIYVQSLVSPGLLIERPANSKNESK